MNKQREIKEAKIIFDRINKAESMLFHFNKEKENLYKTLKKIAKITEDKNLMDLVKNKVNKLEKEISKLEEELEININEIKEAMKDVNTK